MAKAFRTTQIDIEKFKAWFRGLKEKGMVQSTGDFADRIGYNRTFYPNTVARGSSLNRRLRCSKRCTG